MNWKSVERDGVPELNKDGFAQDCKFLSFLNDEIEQGTCFYCHAEKDRQKIRMILDCLDCQLYRKEITPPEGG